jgi:hypothetical protein
MNEKNQFKHGSLIFSLPRVYIYICNFNTQGHNTTTV